MTVIERRSATDRDSAPPARSPDDERGGDSTIVVASRWRLALRIARRESLRRPGRTTLVVLLVLVPVAAMTMGIVIARSQVVSDLDGWERRAGSADAVLVGGFPFEIEPPPEVEPITMDDVELPEGSTVIEYDSVYSPVPDIGLEDNDFVEFTDVPLDVLGAGYDLIDGRAPARAGEAAISRKVASASGLGVGSVLELTAPDLTLDVVGVVENIDQLRAQFLIVDDIDRDLVRPGHLQITRLITFPDGVDPVEASQELAMVGAPEPGSFLPPSAAFHLESRWLADGGWSSGGGQPEPELLVVAWASSVVLFAALGIVIAAAFAVSARRQLVTIGQLSANGAPHRLIRRVLALQGTVTALIAAILGVGVGLALVAIGRPIIETVLDRRLVGLDVRPADLVVIAATATAAGTVAALVPARSTARMPVLAALSGRRPVAEPPRWMAPVGLSLFVGGWLILLGVVTTDVASDSSGVFVALAAILGGLGILFGMVCCSPIVVHGVGLLAERLRGSGRLAARSLARTRGRSAAIVTSIATVMAISTAALTAGESVDAQNPDFPSEVFASNTVHLDFHREVFEREHDSFDPVTGHPDSVFRDVPLVDLVTPGPVPSEITEVLDSVMGDVDPLAIRSVGFVGSGHRLAVADDRLLDFLGVGDEAREALDGGAALTATPWAGLRAIAVTTAGERVEITLDALDTDGFVESDGELSATERSASQLGIGGLISEQQAAERDLVVAVPRFLFERPAPLTLDERARINATDPFEPVNSSAFLLPGEDPSTADARSEVNEQIALDGFWRAFAPVEQESNSRLVLTGVTLFVALALTLLVVAIGLSLAASESREERAILLATGASPATLRRLAAVKAVIMTGAAALISVPTSFLVVTTLFRVNDEASPVPWLGVALLGLAVPVVVGVATLVVSDIASRLRPTTTAHLART